MNSMLFEGSNLEEVLAEAQLALGPDMQIEAANRVRRGGLLGFFATEWFEVWATPAEVTEDPVMALLEREESLDEEPFADMVRNAIAADPSPTSSAQRIARRMDEFFGPDDGPMLQEGYYPDIDTTPPVHVASAAPTAPSAPAAPAGGTTLATAPVHTAAVRTAPVAAPNPAPDGPTLGSLPLAEEATPAAVALEDAPRGSSVFSTESNARTGLLWSMLETLEDLPAAPGIPYGPAVVAFVGDAARAQAAASRMGEMTGLWRPDVVVLTRRRELDEIPSWLTIRDLDDAVDRAGRWRQLATPTPIVIDQPVDAGDRAWAVRAITALAADQVRLVTEAWRLPNDVGELGSRLGGVDALDLVEVDDAVEPLAMLDLGIPVGTVEGRTATADLLAAVWLENRRRG